MTLIARGGIHRFFTVYIPIELDVMNITALSIYLILLQILLRYFTSIPPRLYR